MIDLEKSLRVGLPEARVVPNRDKAAAMGVDAATRRRDRARHDRRARRRDVPGGRRAPRRPDSRCRTASATTCRPSRISGCARASGDLVDLRNVIEIERGATAATIERTDRVRSVELMANLEGLALSEAVARAQAIADEILPSEMSLRLTGAMPRRCARAGQPVHAHARPRRARDLHGARQRSSRASRSRSS